MIGLGSIVNFNGTYAIAVVTELVTAGVDTVWRCTTYSGAGDPINFQVPESQLWEIAFVPWPAGFGPGDIVEVQDTGQFWGIPQGQGVRIGRGMLVYPVEASQGGVVLPCAWVQMENGRPAVIALYSALTIVRKFGAPIP